MNSPIQPIGEGWFVPELLANVAGMPAALRLRPCGPIDWLNSPWLHSLIRQAPCVVCAADLPDEPPTRHSVEAIGILVAPSETLWTADREWPQNPPSGTAWIQGNGYLNQVIKPNAAQAASRQRAMTLIQLVADDADTHELEAIFRQDAGLAYQLLRMVNSPAQGLRRTITSFSQALLILGRQPLKRWLNLLLFAARDDDPRSAMLMARVVFRARGMELLAQQAGMDRTQQEQVFMAGMFSMLDVLMGQPLTDILRPIAITDELRAALLERQGPIAHCLTRWEALESGDCHRSRDAIEAFNLSPHEASALLADAAGWTFQLIRGPMNDD